MKVKDIVRKTNMLPLGKFSKLTSPGRSIKVKSFYDVLAFDAAGEQIDITENGYKTNVKTVKNNSQFGEWLAYLLRNKAERVIVSVFYKSPFNKVGYSQDAILILCRKDNRWEVESYNVFP